MKVETTMDPIMDQCARCVKRGKFEECVATPCSIHEAWYVGELRKMLKLYQNDLQACQGALCDATTAMDVLRDAL
jgi:hypothetical protein